MQNENGRSEVCIFHFLTYHFAFRAAAEPADHGYPAAWLVSPLDQQRVAALSMACLRPRVSWHLTPIAIRCAGTSERVGFRGTCETDISTVASFLSTPTPEMGSACIIRRHPESACCAPDGWHLILQSGVPRRWWRQARYGRAMWEGILSGEVLAAVDQVERRVRA